MRTGVVSALALGLLTAACSSSEDQRANTNAPNEAAPGTAEGSWSSLSLEHSVRRAQSELKREGLYEGRVDGIAGPQTKQLTNSSSARDCNRTGASTRRPAAHDHHCPAYARRLERDAPGRHHRRERQFHASDRTRCGGVDPDRHLRQSTRGRPEWHRHSPLRQAIFRSRERSCIRTRTLSPA